MNPIKKVCIIDDDPISIYGAKKIMENTNFCESFLIYKNGQLALDGLNKIGKKDEKSLPEIILLDLNMPVMDGWEFLEEYDKVMVSKKPMLYIFSSSINPLDISKAKTNPNIQNFISKPMSESVLQELREDLGN